MSTFFSVPVHGQSVTTHPFQQPRNVAEMQSDWVSKNRPLAGWVSLVFSLQKMVIPDTSCLILVVHWQHAAKPFDFGVLYPFFVGGKAKCLMLLWAQIVQLFLF